ncbi:unnamed protein product [Hermetia illucens]|uniref:F-box domain-containing protein n=1 Tax=Hermetia illucens TaxID=343691 RepID=A0A7R8YS29_HERIL|nr:unnamed protein product [Hermetia illucens]
MSRPESEKDNSELENGESPFDRLTDKILEKIFGYFEPAEIIENLVLVCERWRTIIEAMKKCVSFNDCEARAILQFICRFPDTLKSIRLNNVFGSIAVILKKLRRKQKYLKQIHIDSCQIVPNKNPYVAGRRLRNFIEVCRYLEKLSLKNVEYRVDDLLDAFPFLENLRALAIGNNPWLQPVDVITIIMNCTNLRSITLYHIDSMRDQDMKFLLCNKRLNENLQELSLDQVTELTSIAYQYILNCKNLKKLHINYSTGFSADTLMEIPIKLSSLRSFNIERACRISCGNLCEFFKDRALKLHEFGLTDLSGCETLESEMNMKTESCMNLIKVTLPNHLSEAHQRITKSDSIKLEFQEIGDYQEAIDIESVSFV